MIINQKFAEFAVNAALDEVMNTIDRLEGYRHIKTARGEELRTDSTGLSIEIAEALEEIIGMPVKFLCTGGQCHVWVGNNKTCVDLNTPRAYERRIEEIKKLPVKLCTGHMDRVA